MTTAAVHSNRTKCGAQIPCSGNLYRGHAATICKTAGQKSTLKQVFGFFCLFVLFFFKSAAEIRNLHTTTASACALTFGSTMRVNCQWPPRRSSTIPPRRSSTKIPSQELSMRVNYRVTLSKNGIKFEELSCSGSFTVFTAARPWSLFYYKRISSKNTSLTFVVTKPLLKMSLYVCTISYLQRLCAALMQLLNTVE